MKNIITEIRNSDKQLVAVLNNAKVVAITDATSSFMGTVQKNCIVYTDDKQIHLQGISVEMASKAIFGNTTESV
jgi:UDP-N-acetyl-D-mannosaminuronic acid transferase (WecB/TagA/CpsF family)